MIGKTESHEVDHACLRPMWKITPVDLEIGLGVKETRRQKRSDGPTGRPVNEETGWKPMLVRR